MARRRAKAANADEEVIEVCRPLTARNGIYCTHMRDEGDDVLSMLLAARHEDGSPMTEQDLRDELVTLLTDGPTSSLLSWSFERILRHPDKLARLRLPLLSHTGIEEMRERGESLPAGIALDAQGRPTTDHTAAIAGLKPR